jgi:hypothetical protein
MLYYNVVGIDLRVQVPEFDGYLTRGCRRALSRLARFVPR